MLLRMLLLMVLMEDVALTFWRVERLRMRRGRASIPRPSTWHGSLTTRVRGRRIPIGRMVLGVVRRGVGAIGRRTRVRVIRVSRRWRWRVSSRVIRAAGFVMLRLLLSRPWSLVARVWVSAVARRQRAPCVRMSVLGSPVARRGSSRLAAARNPALPPLNLATLHFAPLHLAPLSVAPFTLAILHLLAIPLLAFSVLHLPLAVPVHSLTFRDVPALIVFKHPNRPLGIVLSRGRWFLASAIHGFVWQTRPAVLQRSAALGNAWE